MNAMILTVFIVIPFKIGNQVDRSKTCMWEFIPTIPTGKAKSVQHPGSELADNLISPQSSKARKQSAWLSSSREGPCGTESHFTV